VTWLHSGCTNAPELYAKHTLTALLKLTPVLPMMELLTASKLLRQTAQSDKIENMTRFEVRNVNIHIVVVS
jgi:hypothetical protein